MSDKLISLESVLKEIRRFKGYIDDDMIERFSIAFKRLSPVELPMSAVEYLKVRERMASELGELCSACHCEGKCWDCLYHAPDVEDEMKYPDRSVALVKEWAKEHPEKKHKTYAEDFFEKFPKAWRRDGMPCTCRNEVYKGKSCPLGTRARFDPDCAACWNEEMGGVKDEID